ncbi:MAG TPA: DUF6519 domain-containing protein [Acidocella sp.]|jgi:hypothetical protein|nr:DUF6519 domain-containing protein [Acidocella sp.]
MTIDIARSSYNATTRSWRAVLAQQGRVTLEADVNEQTAIASAALQAETVDIIGPIGTPDGGYLVSPAGTDLQVGKGTIYAGGLRLTQEKPVLTADQPGWLDMPAWPAPSGNQTIALQVITQSVSAVEDQTLREVALGGPDTAGRLVYLQHLLRLPTTASDCAGAAAALKTTLQQQGMDYDASTCALRYTARLKVSVLEAAKQSDPCQPQATGGYLGADNQMIRVAIAGFDNMAGTGTLVWGYDNASFLYRATPANGGNIVTLLSDPLDPDHTPQANQAVELLLCTEDLGDGDPAHSAAGGNFIAAAVGAVMVLGSNPYTASNRQLQLPGAPPANADGKLPLFVRLWNQQVKFTLGTAVTLGETGLQVTITDLKLPTLTAFQARPFWHFAARPSTPQQLYPQRYLDAPQPPEGPVQYLAPLGVVGWSNNAFSLIEDCSLPFLPLTKLHDCSCCALVLDPNKDWLTTLTQAAANSAITALSVCFQPGTFDVTNKITISNKSVHMTGAGYGTLITGPGLEAVLEFDNCADVTLADFCVSAGTADYRPSTGTQGLQGAVTLRGCTQIDISRMKFTCADADLRSASCLAIYNPSGPAPSGQSYNARVRDSRFEPGHSQVGILLVNADRAQVEGNVVVTPYASRNITLTNLGQYKMTAMRLRKQLLHSVILTSTAPPTTKKAKARARKREAAKPAAANTAPKSKASPPATPAASDATGATPAAPKTQAAAVKQAAKKTDAAHTAKTIAKAAVPHVDLSSIGRAQIKATFGTTHVSFLSSDKLTNAWSDALRSSQLSATSTMGMIHRTIRQLATNIVTKPETAAPAFRTWMAASLPQLYSTSGQGIVVGGDFANDVRIIGNTIDGTCQGIHVGLSDLKKDGKHPGHRSAARVQIKGNTVNIRVTPETTGDRHGIYLGCVQSGLVAENHLTLTRSPSATAAGQYIDAIKIAGYFGQSLLVERNNMTGFTVGIYTAQDATSPVDHVLWIISENASDAAHQITGGGMFVTANNIP